MRKNIDKIALVIVIGLLVLSGGYLERGYVDWLGAIALSTLAVPMLITWIKEGR